LIDNIQFHGAKVKFISDFKNFKFQRFQISRISDFKSKLSVLSSPTKLFSTIYALFFASQTRRTEEFYQSERIFC
jgi:hypothetical protein